MLTLSSQLDSKRQDSSKQRRMLQTSFRGRKFADFHAMGSGTVFYSTDEVSHAQLGYNECVCGLWIWLICNDKDMQWPFPARFANSRVTFKPPIREICVALPRVVLLHVSSRASAHWILQTNAKSDIQTHMSHIQTQTYKKWYTDRGIYHIPAYTKSRLPSLCLLYSLSDVCVKGGEASMQWMTLTVRRVRLSSARDQCVTNASKATVPAGLWRWLSDGWGWAGWWANRSIHARQHGRIVFSFQVFETWWDGGLIVCPCVRTAFAGDIYNAVEMAKQAPEERVLLVLSFLFTNFVAQILIGTGRRWQATLALLVLVQSENPKGSINLVCWVQGPGNQMEENDTHANSYLWRFNQNMHLRPQDITPGGWKEKQTVNKQVLTLLEH